jgi:hypothetical protein
LIEKSRRAQAMVEVPSWILIALGVALFVLTCRKRPKTVFLYDREKGQ